MAHTAASGVGLGLAVSRRLERVQAGLTANGVNTFLAPAVAHKFEVVGVSAVCTDATGIVDVHMYDGSYWPRDRIAFTGQPAVLYRAYEGLVVYAGEQLRISNTVTGAPYLLALVDYVDVDFS